MGNYDLGICGLDWIQELIVKYPASGLVKVRDLGYGARSLFLAADRTLRILFAGVYPGTATRSSVLPASILTWQNLYL